MIDDDVLPDDVFEQLGKVSFLFEEGKKQKAMRKLKTLKKRCPNNRYLRSIAFNLSYAADYLDDALEDARFLAEYARDSEDKLNLAECLIRMDRVEEADKVLSGCSDLAGRSGRYHFLLGILKNRHGDIVSANKELMTLFSLEKKDEWPYRMSGHLLLAKNLLDEGNLSAAKEEARLAAREAEDPETLADAIGAIDSFIIAYEATKEVVKSGKKSEPGDRRFH